MTRIAPAPVPTILNDAPGGALARFVRLAGAKGVWALADQAILSAGNFLTGFVLIRHWRTAPASYGLYASVLYVIQFLNSLHSSLVTYPLTVRGAAGGGGAFRRLTGRSMGLTVCLAPLLCVALVVCTAAAGRLSLLPYAAGALLLWQLQETLRRGMISRLRYRDALPGDAVSYLGQAGLIWLLSRRGPLTPEAVFAAVGATSGAAALIQSIQLRTLPGGWRRLAPSAARCWRIGRWLLLTSLVSAATVYVGPWTLQAARGHEEVGKFLALATLLNLTNPVMFSVCGLIVPAVAAARRSKGFAASKSAALGYAGQGAVLLVPYFALLLLFPRFALRAFCGPASPYLGLTTPLRLFVACYAISYVGMTCAAALNGLERARATFLATVVGGGANLLICVPLAIRFGITGAAWGGVAPILLQSAAAAWLLWRAKEKRAPAATTPPRSADDSVGGRPGPPESKLRHATKLMATTPVSILLPAYNAARHLDEAVLSLLRQSHGDFELLAIDDGSTDATRDILLSYAAKDSRVKVISHPNTGMGRSLNAALEVARHEWVVRMDADDVAMPNRIERQLAFVAERPNLAVASALVRYIDDAGRVIGRGVSEYTDPARVRKARDRNWLIGFHHPAVIMRRDVVRAVGGYRPQFWPADDADLWNRIAERDPLDPGLLVQPECLLLYRIHAASVCVSSSRLTAQKAEWAEACIKLRRAGRPEVSWEQFRRERRQLSLPRRLDRGRREYARTLYKAAVSHYAGGRYARFVPALMGAALLEPGFVLPRVAGVGGGSC